MEFFQRIYKEIRWKQDKKLVEMHQEKIATVLLRAFSVGRGVAKRADEVIVSSRKELGFNLEDISVFILIDNEYIKQKLMRAYEIAHPDLDPNIRRETRIENALHEILSTKKW